MKKILLMAVVLFTAVAANAQVSFGIKGGLNVTTMSLDNKVLESSNRAGFYIGPTVKFSLPIVGLGLDLSAFYNQRTLNFDGVDTETKTVYEETTKHKSISIPLNIRYQIVGLGDTAGLFLFTGPQIDFNVGDKEIIKEAKDWTFNTSDFSWNVGVGVMVANHLQVNANYNIGLSKTGEVKDDYVATLLQAAGLKDSKQNTWQVGVAYFF